MKIKPKPLQLILTLSVSLSPPQLRSLLFIYSLPSCIPDYKNFPWNWHAFPSLSLPLLSSSTFKVQLCSCSFGAFSSVQSFSRVRLFATPWIAAHQASLHHQLPEFTQTHVHRVSDAIQPFHPLSSPSPPAPNPSQHQGLFQWANSLHEVAKVLEFQLQHQSFQWTHRTYRL